jgi:hypothetical protein
VGWEREAECGFLALSQRTVLTKSTYYASALSSSEESLRRRLCAAPPVLLPVVSLWTMLYKSTELPKMAVLTK